MELIYLVIIAALIEAVWQNLKMIWKTGEVNFNKVGTLVLGIFVAVSAGMDIFAMIGIPLAVVYAGEVLTGVLVSRGANVVHELIDRIQDYGGE